MSPFTGGYVKSACTMYRDIGSYLQLGGGGGLSDLFCWRFFIRIKCAKKRTYCQLICLIIAVHGTPPRQKDVNVIMYILLFGRRYMTMMSLFHNINFPTKFILGGGQSTHSAPNFFIGGGQAWPSAPTFLRH